MQFVFPLQKNRGYRFASLLTPFFIFVLFLTACSKGSGDDDGDDDGPGRQVSEVVPAAYRETLTSHGFRINEGTTPPTVNGKFLISKYRFDYDNHREPGVYPSPGTFMDDLVITFANQQADQSFSPSFGGGFLAGTTLEDPFITGSGNAFTACFRVNIAGGSGGLFVYPFVYLISGTVEGEVLKNVKVAVVGLEDDTPDEFTVAGEVDLYSDADGTSPKTP